MKGPVSLLSESIEPREDSRSSDRSLVSDLGGLIVSVVAALAVAGVAALSSSAAIEGWYAASEKTIWTPPNEVFGPIWGLLYTLMAVAAWLVWRQPISSSRYVALGLYAGQLAMTAAWTPLFFVGYDLVGGLGLWVSLVWIVLLDFVVLTTVVRFWAVSKVGAVLMLPYWMWLLFATALNASIAVMNS